MKKADILALVKSHNANVEGFKAVCAALEDAQENMPKGEKIRVSHFKTSFARHAATLVRMARTSQMTAQHDIVDGTITIGKGDNRTRTYYGVTTTVYDDGHITAEITEVVKGGEKPENTGDEFPNHDVYIDWFEKYSDAKKLVKEAGKRG